MAEQDQTKIRDQHSSDSSYIIPSRIMVSAISVLVVVIILIVCLHVYARCCLLGSHRSQHQPRRARRRLRLRVVVAPRDGSSVVQTAPAHAHARGLDEAAVRSLPMFIFSSESGACGEKAGMYCAVCLCEFEDKEKGRLLPNCKHCFHTDCIDMWFLSHSTCPLCRAPVFEHNAVVLSETAAATSVMEEAISPDVVPVNANDNRESSCATLIIENETDLPTSSSSSSQSGALILSSTGGGFLSLKRILNREGTLLSPGRQGRSSAVEYDIEQGPSPKAST